MAHLLAISIGPVQDFIVAARRSRDLWFASWLLSEVAKAAARRVEERARAVPVASLGLEPGLIFPAPVDSATLAEGTTLNIANKIVALVADSPDDVAREAEAAARDRLRRLGAEALDAMSVSLPAHNRLLAELQIADLLEFSWTAVSIASAADYPGQRARAEALLGARKATRTFAPVGAWGDDVPKSSLDGQRESVIPEEVYDMYRGRPGDLFRDYGLRQGERLCGVGLLKRHGQRSSEDGRVFSTSHVAALPLLARLRPEKDMAEGERQRQALEQYIGHLREAGVCDADLGNVPGAENGVFGHYDGHLLFEERLRDYIANTDVDNGKLASVREALQAFLEAVFDGAVPCPYYALLHADGDRMGMAIDAQRTPDDHRKLSRALDGFAGAVRSIVANYDGSLVYAGGDDVLAFLPLHLAIPCARTLADDFRRRLAGFPTADGEAPSLSVGIAIAHHLEPLSDALTLVRAAERSAKRHPGKDALAVTLSKRSGAERTVVGGWRDDQTPIGPLDRRLGEFVRLHQSGAMPDGLAYELAALDRRLATPDADLAARLAAPLRREATRILDRKRDESGRRLKDETVERLAGLLSTAAPPGAEQGAIPTIAQIADEMIIARTIADAARLAPPERAGEDEGTAQVAD